jgi:holo-[acyl-carrier protein] synthase
VIIGVGIDIVSLDAFRRRLDDALREELFSPVEIAYARTQARSWEHYAARFAAKEAAFKALGAGLAQGMRHSDVEVVRDPAGAVELRLSGRAAEIAAERGLSASHLSITHSRSGAAAVVVLEGRKEDSS